MSFTLAPLTLLFPLHPVANHRFSYSFIIPFIPCCPLKLEFAFHMINHSLKPLSFLILPISLLRVTYFYTKHYVCVKLSFVQFGWKWGSCIPHFPPSSTTVVFSWNLISERFTPYCFLFHYLFYQRSPKYKKTTPMLSVLFIFYNLRSLASEGFVSSSTITM